MKGAVLSLDGLSLVPVEGLEPGDLAAATSTGTGYTLTDRADADTWITISEVQVASEDVCVVTGSFTDGMPYIARVDRGCSVIAHPPIGGQS